MAAGKRQGFGSWLLEGSALGVALLAASCSQSSTMGGATTQAGGTAGVTSAGGVTGTTSEAGTAGATSPGGAAGMSSQDGATVSLDLSNYYPGSMPPSLFVTNSTLVFPLAVAPLEQSLTQGQPGDLLVAYTRVGCTVDPDEWIGPMGPASVSVAPVAAATLTRVTIDLDSRAPTLAPGDWAQSICLSVRIPGGVWRPFLQPTNVDASSSPVRIEFSVPDDHADAAAIFLPDSSISRITYSLTTD